MTTKNIRSVLFDYISIDEVIIFGASIFIGYKTQVLYGVLLAIICLWIKLKYYEGRIIEAYNLISKKEKDINSNPDISQNLAKRRICKETSTYYDQIQRQYEPKRKFLIDKLIIVTFIGLLLVSKFQ